MVSRKPICFVGHNHAGRRCLVNTKMIGGVEYVVCAAVSDVFAPDVPTSRVEAWLVAHGERLRTRCQQTHGGVA